MKRPGWHLPERLVTPESVYTNRRTFLRSLGFAGAGLFATFGTGCNRSEPVEATEASVEAAGGATHQVQSAVGAVRYPAARNSEFNPDWMVTEESVAANYNNFYEFTTGKQNVGRLARSLVIEPWPIEIGGLVEKPITVDVEELVSEMPLEERVYRFRCVEAWAMIVPWTGFPLSKLIEKVQPKSEARFVRFVTFYRPEQAPGQRDRSYPWPYAEGLRLDEALNPLTLVATGIYGKPLPKQHGAPIRIVAPWKYGYKSIKSVVKIELVAEQPATMWQTLAPHEYPFESNVNPAIDHPRWSQATERMIDSGIRMRTQPFNGYGQYVAQLY